MMLSTTVIFLLVNGLIVAAALAEIAALYPVALVEWLSVSTDVMATASLWPAVVQEGLRDDGLRGSAQRAEAVNGGTAPAVSVILPVHNGARHLETAVRSVLDQTFRDFEVIAIDDGSRDESSTILRQFAAQDQRVRVISREHRGFVSTLNEALALTRGRYIARMDQDDLSHPQRFKRQLNCMETNPQLVAVGSRVIAIDPEDRVLGLERLPLTHQEIEDCHLCGQSAICHPATMMRTQALRDIGGYREFSPVEDFDLWLRLGEVGRLENIEEPLLRYRRSTTGMVATYAPKRIAMLERVMKDVWRRRGLPGQPEIQREKARSRADIYRQWGWMALDEGRAATARTYAWQAVRADPLTWRSWWLAICALRQRAHHQHAEGAINDLADSPTREVHGNV